MYKVRSDKGNKQESIIRRLLFLIGDNPNREGLIETPRRVINSYKELFSGYSYSESDIENIFIKQFTETENYDEIIICKNIPFISFCEHHLLPFSGLVHIGYLPDKKTVGLSKLPRIVDVFAKRLQIQERLTSQITRTLMTYIQPQGVGTIIEAEHLCITCRGIKKTGSKMITSCLEGVFQDPIVKNEFINLLRN